MSKFDIIIKGGLVIDGLSPIPIRTDLGIKGDTVVKLGDLSRCSAEISIDARGRIVTPGFIDIHNHSDISIFVEPSAENYVRQGVTTLVVGNCGSSPAPLTELNKEHIDELMWGATSKEFKPSWDSFSSYLDELSKLRKAVNIAALVGHGTLRSAVAGFDNVRLGDRELRLMKELLTEAMEAGAFGLSAGLIYVPSMFADYRELIELCRVVARYGGIFAVHMRDEGKHLIDSIMESIYVTKESGVSLEISHLKVVGRGNWGKVAIALGIIEDYVSRGFSISADAYPYTASSTFLSTVLPKKLREGSTKALIEKLKSIDINEVKRLIEVEGLMGSRRIEWDQIMISYSKNHPEYEGKKLTELAEELKETPLDVLIDLLIDDEGLTEAVIFGMSEDDVSMVISHPYVAVASDGQIQRFGVGKPHPRNYGTFPRVIAKYVREMKLLDLSEAVRKMTSLPARKLGLWDRGYIAPGAKADIVIFNYDVIKDKATYTDPHQYPVGIDYVIINGSIVISNGELTKERPGKLLRRS